MKKMLTFSALLAIALLQADVAETAKSELAQVVQQTITRQAENGWLYSKNEFQHLAKGELINGKVAEVSACKQKANADPTTALVEFNTKLNELGIKLILLPVPPKVAIYPTAGLKAGEAMAYLAPFYQELRNKGLDVVDLSEVFIQHQTENVYCKTDAHWSPAGIELATSELAKKIEQKGETKFTVKQQEVTISGDLAKSLSASDPAQEKITINIVDGDVFSDSSPILVLGDSHTLVFSSGGDMLAENAGFCEQLALKLWQPIDRIGVKGSAATAVRTNLYRKAVKNPAWLKRKKYVIYVFSCREFTEAASGWAKIPILK